MKKPGRKTEQLFSCPALPAHIHFFPLFCSTSGRPVRASRIASTKPKAPALSAAIQSHPLRPEKPRPGIAGNRLPVREDRERAVHLIIH